MGLRRMYKAAMKNIAVTFVLLLNFITVARADTYDVRQNLVNGCTVWNSFWYSGEPRKDVFKIYYKNGVPHKVTVYNWNDGQNLNPANYELYTQNAITKTFRYTQTQYLKKQVDLSIIGLLGFKDFSKALSFHYYTVDSANYPTIKITNKPCD